MEIEIITIDTTAPFFDATFNKYRDDFLRILAQSYQTYFGDDYQLKRIVEEQSVLFLAIADGLLVGVSYIKNNLRRGGTAVFPEQYRRKGIAEALVQESLKTFPKQYTILRVENHNMLSLMRKVGFKRATTPQEIELLVPAEFAQLSGFKFIGEYLVFRRRSFRRGADREDLTLLHTF